MRDLPSLEEAAEILKRRRTRPMRRPPPAAGRPVARLVRALDKQFGGPGVGPLQARWREIVGETLARRSEPVRLSRPRGGGPAALELRVDGPAATLIQHQAPDIIARVNLFLGAGAVERLRIVQGPLRGQVRPRELPRPRAPIRLDLPLDAAREQALEASLGAIGEGPLRAALLRLGRAVHRRDGG